MTLPAYNPEASCPKCGFDIVSTRYCHQLWDESYCSGSPSAGVPAHLDRRCGRCSFRWREATIEQTELERLIADAKALQNGATLRKVMAAGGDICPVEGCTLPRDNHLHTCVAELLMSVIEGGDQLLYHGFCGKPLGHIGAHEATVTIPEAKDGR